jgi:imidazolonepropionase-like amidohydrolase
MRQRIDQQTFVEEASVKRSAIWCFLLCVCIGMFFLSSGTNAWAADDKASAGDGITALVGAKIYPAPDAPAIENGIVLVQNGKITAVGINDKVHFPRGAKAIDCAGKTIVAGFWNSHVHFTEPKWNNAASLPAGQLTSQIQEMLTRYGFTSVVDTGSVPANTVALRKRVESGEALGPRILTAGSPLYPHNGIPYYVLETLPPEIIKLLNQPSTPEEAVREVDDDIAQGADIIKLFVVSWVKRNGKPTPFPMKPEIVKAATDEAHRKGKLVFAHPSTIEGVELVLQGRVDVLAHTIEDPGNWTDPVVARLKAANVSLIPTLTLFSGDDDADGIRHEVKSFADAGGRILFGTDIGFITDYQALTREFEFMSRAGLTFPQILASLTTNPAERFGFTKSTGRVAKGMDADLVVLDGDPAKDIMAFSRVRMTMKAGRVVYHSGK